MVLTNWLLGHGITRDSEMWLWTKILAVCTLIATGVLDVGYWLSYVGLHPSVAVVHAVQVCAVIVLYLAGQYSTSTLPGKKIVAAFLPLLIVAGLGLTLAGCAGHASPKVVIDLADRPAYGALKAFDAAEEQAYHAKGVWPTPAQHQAISQKFVAGYQLVIDVARIGVALPPGSTLSAADLAAVGQLTALVADFAAIVGAPNVSTDVQAAFSTFQREATTLLATVKGQ